MVFLDKYEWNLTSSILGTVLTEPVQGIKSGFNYPYNWKKHFNFYNLNPNSITEKQAEKRPLLLLHGDYHNQSAWLSFAEKIKGSNLGPVYTVNLPNGNISINDYEIIHKKILLIKSQYKHHGQDNIKIDLIGHSRGGILAHRMAWTTLNVDGEIYWNRSDDIGKIIKIGSVLSQEEINHITRVDPNFSHRLYEITGQYDALLKDVSLCLPNHQVIVSRGHLGLLYSDYVHQLIMRWLL